MYYHLLQKEAYLMKVELENLYRSENYKGAISDVEKSVSTDHKCYEEEKGGVVQEGFCGTGESRGR